MQHLDQSQWHYVEWKKPVTEEYILYDSSISTLGSGKANLWWKKKSAEWFPLEGVRSNWEGTWDNRNVLYLDWGGLSKFYI